MPADLTLLCAAVSPSTPAAASLSLTQALLIVCFGGLLVAAYQLNRVVHRLAALERRLTVAPGPQRPASTPRAREAAPGQLSPQLVAVIAAACEDALEGPVQIVAITDGSQQKQVWSLEGRRQIFASHQVR
jgi:hypothetical protein